MARPRPLRIEGPMLSNGFSMILLGELEVIAVVPGEGDEEEDIMGKEGMMEGIYGWYRGRGAVFD